MRRHPFFWAVMAAIGGLILISLMSSCSPAKYCSRHGYGEIQTDSVVVTHEVIKEKTIIDTFSLPADTSYSIALIKCDSSGKATISAIKQHNGKRSSSSLQLINNVLTAGCECDSVGILKTFTTRDTISRTNSVLTKVVQKEVPAQLTGWQKMKLRSWVWFFAFTLGYALLKIGKVILKFYGYKIPFLS